MIAVNIDSMAKTYGSHQILKNFSMSINKGEKVALIGANGSGKTTIFKILTGQENYQKGNLSLKNDLSIGMLAQEPEFEDDNTVYEELLTVFSDLQKLEDKIKSLEDKISMFDKEDKNHKKLEELMNEYSKLSHQYEINGGYKYENEIIQIS